MNKHIAIATSLGGAKSLIDIQIGLDGLRTLFKASLRLVHDDISYQLQHLKFKYYLITN